MSIAKRHRPAKRQLGQFITPAPLAEQLLDEVELRPELTILEPSFGDGAFVLPVLRRLIEQHAGSPAERLAQSLARNLHGVELDQSLACRCLQRIENEFGPLPPEHHLMQGDFFRHEFNGTEKGSELLFVSGTSKNSSDPFFMFDLILGNPPFGGTFDATIEDQLDRSLGEQLDAHRERVDRQSQ